MRSPPPYLTFGVNHDAASVYHRRSDRRARPVAFGPRRRQGREKEKQEERPGHRGRLQEAGRQQRRETQPRGVHEGWRRTQEEEGRRTGQERRQREQALSLDEVGEVVEGREEMKAKKEKKGK